MGKHATGQADQELRALKGALVAYFIVLGLKLAAFALTHVLAILAEALHTLSDIFVTGFLLAATLWSRRPPDRLYGFGYGRAQNAAALVAATLFVSFTSLRLLEEAIPRLWAPPDAEYANLDLAVGVLAISMVVAGVPLFQLARTRQRGAAAKAQFLESINDELGLVAALGGTVLIGLGWPLADAIASILVAVIIGYNGIGLLVENFKLLTGRLPDPGLLDTIRARAQSVRGVIAIHDLRAESIGAGRIHADFHVEVAAGTPIEEADRIAERVRSVVHRDLPSSLCSVHVQPPRPGRSATGIAGRRRRMAKPKR